MEGGPVDLSLVRSQKKKDGEEEESKFCEFCGDEKHEQPLQCPRIAAVTKYSDGSQIDIYFTMDFYAPEFEIEKDDDEPDGAA